jgi:thymidine kinase
MFHLYGKLSTVNWPIVDHEITLPYMTYGLVFLIYSTELLRRIKRYQIANHRCLVVKYEKDNRYDIDNVATHDR